MVGLRGGGQESPADSLLSSAPASQYVQPQPASELDISQTLVDEVKQIYGEEIDIARIDGKNKNETLTAG